MNDNTPIGRNDFYNEYTTNPVCGRFIGGFEIDIEPSSYGVSNLHVSVPSQMYMSNLDIYSAYTQMIHYFMSRKQLELVKPYNKYANE